MTETPALELPDPKVRPTLPVWPDTGRLLGLSKSATYEGVRTGQIPSIRVGRRLLVPTAALRRLLCVDASARDGGEAA